MIFALTGAGISAESGISTFRSEGGLWNQEKVDDVATPEGFLRDPARIHSFYDGLHAMISAAKPNAAHDALARLERESGMPMTIVTQNIDDLHERAGSRNVIHIHGSIFRGYCDACGHDAGHKMGRLASEGACEDCGKPVRPDIVWFGEQIKHQLEIEDALRAAKIFLAVGTSGNVYPAADFARRAANRRARTIEFNLRKTEMSRKFRESRMGPAGSTLPLFVDAFLRDEAQRPK